MVEKFKDSDIQRYKELKPKLDVGQSLLVVTYEFDKFKLPVELFGHLLLQKRPDLLKYAPYEVTVKKLIRGSNPWLQETHYLGLNYDEKLVLFLDEDFEHSEVGLLWILFHEFRHKIQCLNHSIKSCVENTNFRHLERYLQRKENTKDTIEHVLHEIYPFEVDANTFACEILDIDYPSSKFQITEETMSQLK